MKLKLGDIKIADIKLADKTQIKDHILYVNPDDLKTELLRDSRITDI